MQFAGQRYRTRDTEYGIPRCRKLMRTVSRDALKSYDISRYIVIHFLIGLNSDNQ